MKKNLNAKKSLEFSQSLKKSIAFLHFADGTSFKGYVNKDSTYSPLQTGIWGEAAFTTGMTGYQETATDPSFLGQHIIYTSSHIGNYPSKDSANQSTKCHATCLIAKNFSQNEFFDNLESPLFSGIDTRSLVKYLTATDSSLHKSVLTFTESCPTKSDFLNAKLSCQKLDLVGQDKKQVLIAGENPIVLINYGVKQSIINHLTSFGLPLITLPHTATASDIKKYSPRLIFLSNGPGDPTAYTDQVQNIKEMLALNIPLRGICLGHQLLGLALGAKIEKLPFGQRGINHPCLNHISGNVLITSQNHGYSIHHNSFLDIKNNNTANKEFIISYSSLFDQSIEGIASLDHQIKTVQFHPEASPGPSDAYEFFIEINNFLNQDSSSKTEIDKEKLSPIINLLQDTQKFDLKSNPYKKILLIGSGPIKIGQASEFDYSGTQALKSLKEIGIDVVLLNSNPATIMTDPEMAYRTYIEPITKDTIKKIIISENVDAVLSTMGGQTALNICVELEEENFLEKNGVALLGANVDTIKKTEDRDLFASELKTLGYQTGKRFKAHDEDDAVAMAKSVVGYPLIIRRDFALGGKGAALAVNEEDLIEVFKSDVQFPITLEKSLVGHIEIELEVMVDKNKNGVIICSIENIDPCGIHTGDSITVAPAQTISDHCYQQLRTMSLTIAKHMGVVAGGANVQFAINPLDENDIVVIEMNPRVSRSSALASKATGYPIAKISALLSIGLTLKDILNDITKASPVAFEPTLDYVAIKIPIFPFNKFPTSSTMLGPQMRSVGEVLALGSNFNETFLKALRSLEMGLEIPMLSQLKTTPFEIDNEYLVKRLSDRQQLSLLTVLEALRSGMDKEKIKRLSQISIWFIDQMELLFTLEQLLKTKASEIAADEIPLIYKDDIIQAKKFGFSDKYLALLLNKGLSDIFNFRMENNIIPCFRAVDTCSGEFNALTPYFYSTYTGETNEAISLSSQGPSISILGSGPNRIGQGIEFDYSCVKSCMHLKSKKIQAIMINSNPETVSTDYDSSNRLYLAPLFSEDIFDILYNEKSDSVISCFSGQTGINIRKYLEAPFRQKYYEIKFLGPSLKTLDLTEDRKLFSEITKKSDLCHTKAVEIRGHKKLVDAMVTIGLPVIIRPSYVIGGESMYIINSHDELKELPNELKDQLTQATTTFQVENYLVNAKEYDVDLIRDNHNNCVFTICEHIENAGVHSGDSGMITPPVALTSKLYNKMKEISIDIASNLEIVGPVNFQYAVKDGEIYCIEANPRGSRTLPFLSKAYNLSLPSLATDAMIGETIENWEREQSPYFCVKQSTFPFDRFLADNIILGPKMRSTGETMGIDIDKEHAMLKSYLGNYPNITQKGKILISLSDQHKDVLLPYLKQLGKLGLEFWATKGTYDFIMKQGISCQLVSKISQGNGTSLLEIIEDKTMIMVFNTPLNQGASKSDGELIRNTAISHGVPCFTRRENIKSVIEALIGSDLNKIVPMALQVISPLLEK